MRFRQTGTVYPLRVWSFRALLCVVVCVGFYGAFLPLPEQVGMQGIIHTVPDEAVVFLADETYLTEDGERHSVQTIFDEVFRMMALLGFV